MDMEQAIPPAQNPWLRQPAFTASLLSRTAVGQGLHHHQIQRPHEVGRLRMRDDSAFQQRSFAQFETVDIGAAQVRALELRQLDGGVAQAAPFENGVAEVAAGQVGVGKSSCLSIALRNEKPRRSAPTSRLSSKVKPR